MIEGWTFNPADWHVRDVSWEELASEQRRRWEAYYEAEQAKIKRRPRRVYNAIMEPES